MNLGICIEGDNIYYAYMDGSKLTPNLRDLIVTNIQQAKNIGELMSFFESDFTAKLSKKFNKIVYCVSEGVEPKRYSKCVYPYAILNKLSFDKGIEILQKTPNNFTNRKIDGKKITEECIKRFKLPKTIKGKQRAVMSAWCEL